MDAYNRAGENRRFVLATGNRDKVTEIRQILHSFPFDVTTMHEEGFRGEIVEDGDTYEANARIKALTVHDQLGGYVMADDSGLSIDALDGVPGIHSARFAGEDAGYPEKIEKIWGDAPGQGRCRMDRRIPLRDRGGAPRPVLIRDPRGLQGHHHPGDAGRQRFRIRPDLLCAGIRLHDRGDDPGAETQDQPQRPGAARHGPAAAKGRTRVCLTDRTI